MRLEARTRALEKAIPEITLQMWIDAMGELFDVPEEEVRAGLNAGAMRREQGRKSFSEIVDQKAADLGMTPAELLRKTGELKREVLEFHRFRVRAN